MLSECKIFRNETKNMFSRFVLTQLIQWSEFSVCSLLLTIIPQKILEDTKAHWKFLCLFYFLGQNAAHIHGKVDFGAP